MPERNAQGFQFKIDWKTSTLVVVLMPVFLWLGFWQMDRAEEKRQLQALYAQRQNATPVPVEQLDQQSDLRYQPVTMRGQYINGKSLLLDNRIHQGKFGYEIITPFKLVNSDWVILVNRGWLAGDRSRRTLPDIDVINNQQLLQGEVYIPSSEMLTLSDIPSTGWPRVVQAINASRIEKDIQQPVFPFTVRLKPAEPGSYLAEWQIVNLQPEKHTGYAVQWFAMAFTLLIIAFLANSNCWALYKSRKQAINKEV